MYVDEREEKLRRFEEDSDGSVEQFSPSDEQAKLLQARLTEAEERIGAANEQIALWSPVLASSQAGLRALKEHRVQPQERD
jgi:hypothetical protein